MGKMKAYPATAETGSEGHEWTASINDHTGNYAWVFSAAADWPDSEAKTNARAARLAAGWNLLETLERMDADNLLECAAIVLEAKGASAGVQDDVCRVAAAIRTALESKP